LRKGLKYWALSLLPQNIDELMALKLTLFLVVGKDVVKFQIFGDSLVVINWMQGVFSLENLCLRPIF
jgi:hypothetical protein